MHFLYQEKQVLSTNTKITNIKITLNNLTTIPLAETIAIITACIWLSDNNKLKNEIFLESPQKTTKITTSPILQPMKIN